MFNLNRRHTEAMEKTAAAKKRLAAAEEAIARDLGAFLEGDEEMEDVKGDSSKRKTAKKPNPEARKE
jgi:hypothetical protein